jgi:Outer membrane efflux protein
MRLQETLANSDATRLSFFPNLTLTGSLGTASTSLSQVVQNPVGTLAAALTAPFIQINQAKISTELARTEYDKAVVNFRKALLQALTDVENALSERTQLAAQAANLERALDAAKAAEHVNEVRSTPRRSAGRPKSHSPRTALAASKTTPPSARRLEGARTSHELLYVSHRVRPRNAIESRTPF